jgi:agmatinase
MAHLVISGQLPRQEKPAYIHPEVSKDLEEYWT